LKSSAQTTFMTYRVGQCAIERILKIGR